MTFGLKNTGATYQRAMNLIFHGLLGVILEVYIDDIVNKSASLDHHITTRDEAFCDKYEFISCHRRLAIKDLL